MSHLEEIYARIPHRPPFLWVDRIISISPDRIEAEKDIPQDLDLFRGHYPGNPLMPGVLLCEAVFQAGSMLITENLKQDEHIQGVPVLTRISGAKFKRMVKPGDTVRIEAWKKEKIGPAWFLAGKIQVAGRTALKVEFACTVTDAD